MAAFTRFTFSTGTNGYGYINVLPCLANDAPVVQYSTSGYAGTPASASDLILAPNTGVSYLNSPYTTADLNAAGNAGARGRIVSIGIRITPVCAASDFGGLVTTYVDPDHSNLAALTGSQITSKPTASVMRARINGHVCFTGGVSSHELEYSNVDTFSGIYPYSTESLNSTDTTIGGTPMVFRIQSATAGVPFYVEIIEHIEFTGPLTSASQTESHIDPSGFAAANTAQTRIHGAVAGKAVDPGAYKSYFMSLFSSALASFTPDSASLGRAVGQGVRNVAIGKIAQLSRGLGGLALMG